MLTELGSNRQANGAVRQDRKMIDGALRHMRDDDFIFKNLSFEVSLWHLLIPFDHKPLTSQIKDAGEFDLISLIGRNTERSSAVFTIFNLREGKRRNRKTKVLKRDRFVGLVVNFQSPFRRHSSNPRAVSP
jgi:hypothetical protein